MEDRAIEDLLERLRTDPSGATRLKAIKCVRVLKMERDMAREGLERYVMHFMNGKRLSDNALAKKIFTDWGKDPNKIPFNDGRRVKWTLPQGWKFKG